MWEVIEDKRLEKLLVMHLGQAGAARARKIRIK